MKKITLGFVTVLFAAAVTLGSGTAVKAAEEETGVCEDIVVQDEIEAQDDIEVRDETKGDEFFAEPTVYCDTKEEAYASGIVTAATELDGKAKQSAKILVTAVSDGNVKKTVTCNVTVTADNKELAWESDKPGVAAVDDRGNITAVSPGTAKITASSTDGSKKKVTVTITVR